MACRSRTRVGQGDIEDGVVDVDDQCRQTHDGQGQSPMSVPLTRHRVISSDEQAHRSSQTAGAPATRAKGHWVVRGTSLRSWFDNLGRAAPGC